MSLTPAESNELRRLLAKAKAAVRNTMGNEPEFETYDPVTGVFVDPTTGVETDVWLAAELAGSMHDGSKRREADSMVSAGSDPKRVLLPKAKAMSAEPSYSATMDDVGTPFPTNVGFELDGPGLPPLPEGIPDLATWGQTVISFGQYKGQLTYEELVSSTNERAQSYVKWCRPRTQSAQGMLKDLCAYMEYYFAADDQRCGYKIPGTDQFRVLRPR